MRALPVSRRRTGPDLTNRARISFEEPGVARCRQVRDSGMASVSQFNPYQCDQCGNANIVAAPVVYHEGTRTYSGTFYSGTTQSYSAQAVAPPHPRGYLRPFLAWGPVILLLSIWTVVGIRSIFEVPKANIFRVELAFLFLLLTVASLTGLVVSLRKVAHYNRTSFPRLRWNWEHTYVCRRCGKLRLIPS